MAGCDRAGDDLCYFRPLTQGGWITAASKSSDGSGNEAEFWEISDASVCVRWKSARAMAIEDDFPSIQQSP